MSTVPRPHIGVPVATPVPPPPPAKLSIREILAAWEAGLVVDAAPPFNVVHPLSWVRKVKVPELLAALKAAGFE